ncbi:MAG: hypothetical protein F8N37_12020 [Telmatospirillum sp.]|nr:hypothetical protein [Telmatospirillum sp.]
MGNVFDQFDAPAAGPAANPFDQFDPPAGKTMGDNGAGWGGVDSFSDGVLQGLGDELKAAAAATKESFSGGLPWSNAYDQALDMYRGARNQYRTDHPVAATAAELGGGLATGLAATPFMPAPAAGLLGRIGQGAATGGAAGALYGFNDGEGGAVDRTKNALISGGIGFGTGVALPAMVAGGARAISPGASRLTPEETRLAQVAADNGIALTPGQQTGSKVLRTVESVFSGLPLTSSKQAQIVGNQQTAFNRAILARAGIDADNAAPDVLAAGKGALGQQFNDLAARNNVALDNPLLDALSTVQQNAQKALEPDQQPIIARYIDGILDQGDQMDGPLYQATRSALSRRAASSNNPELANNLRDIRGALDDAAARSISPEDADAWNTARQQYGNLKTVMAAMNGPHADSGNIPPTQLRQAVARSVGTDAYATGGGDLNDLARVGSAFLRDKSTVNGNVERTTIAHLLTGGLAAGGMEGGGPIAAALAASAGLALPKLLQLAYYSKPGQAFLTNQLTSDLTRSSPLAAALAGVNGPTAARIAGY